MKTWSICLWIVGGIALAFTVDYIANGFQW